MCVCVISLLQEVEVGRASCGPQHPYSPQGSQQVRTALFHLFFLTFPLSALRDRVHQWLPSTNTRVAPFAFFLSFPHPGLILRGEISVETLNQLHAKSR